MLGAAVLQFGFRERAALVFFALTDSLEGVVGPQVNELTAVEGVNGDVNEDRLELLDGVLLGLDGLLGERVSEQEREVIRAECFQQTGLAEVISAGLALRCW